METIKRINSNTETVTATKAGKVVFTARTVVSKDGKVLTITLKGTTNGQPDGDVSIWEKQ